jgi:hypothetical protein
MTDRIYESPVVPVIMEHYCVLITPVYHMVTGVGIFNSQWTCHPNEVDGVAKESYHKLNIKDVTPMAL